MKTQTWSSDYSFLRIIVAITFFLSLGNPITFCQEKENINNISATKNGWWNPILKTHNIDLKKFNYKNVFNMGKDTTETALFLEMGNSDSINNRKISLKDATIISKRAGQTYWIITSKYARHDLDNKLLILMNGQMTCYDYISKNVVDTSSFQEMRIDIKKNNITASSKE